MNKPCEIFKLQGDVANPLFEGFALEPRGNPSLLGRASLLEDISASYAARGSNRNWQPTKLSQIWKPPTVVGNVASFNDFPCINLSIPVFSKRACDALADFLLPNGELLPLRSDVGEYYLFNLTRVVDVFDLERSVYKLFRGRPVAVGIDYFAFHEDLLEGLSIFQIVEEPGSALVTDEFVRRVREHGLNGFSFDKVWPLPEGSHWMSYNKAMRKSEGERDEAFYKKHTLIIGLRLGRVLGIRKGKPWWMERRKITRLERELDAQLAVDSLEAPYFGRYDVCDTIDGEYCMFIGCPDVNALLEKLRPWLENLNWAGGIRIVKRYGNEFDTGAKEERVSL